MGERDNPQNETRYWNLNKPPITVRHADLERASDQSAYRSKCPVCKEGILGMRRDLKTAQLEAHDYCVLCAQPFVYEDIEILRQKEGD